MTVRAKFKVVRLELSKDHTNEVLSTVILNPVYGKIDDPNDENSRFYRWTPII